MDAKISEYKVNIWAEFAGLVVANTAVIMTRRMHISYPSDRFVTSVSNTRVLKKGKWGTHGDRYIKSLITRDSLLHRNYISNKYGNEPFGRRRRGIYEASSIRLSSPMRTQNGISRCTQFVIFRCTLFSRFVMFKERFTLKSSVICQKHGFIPSGTESKFLLNIIQLSDLKDDLNEEAEP